MWQAPALTIAAQAFLLQVIADDSLDWWARLMVLLGGLAAIGTAIFALFRLRAREVQYAEAFAYYAAKPGLPDIRPAALSEIPGPDVEPTRAQRIDAWTRDRAVSSRLPPGHFFWALALLLLALADVAVFVAA